MAGKRVAAQATAKEPAAKQARKRVATQEDFAPQHVLAFLKEHGVSKASYTPVLEVVNHPLTGLSKNVRDMLLAMLPWSVTVPVDQRNEAQQEAVDMVDIVVGNVRTELQQALDVETGKVDDLKATQSELAGRAELAVAASSEASCVVEEHHKRVEEAASVLVQAREALRIAEVEETRLVSELSQTRSMLSEMEDILSGSFKRLKDGDFEDFEVDGLVQAVIVAGVKICLEESLVTALPMCLAKRERGPFDCSVMNEAEKAIQGKIAALGEAVDAAAGPVEVQAALVQNARAGLDAAESQNTLEADQLCRAQAENSEVAAKAEAATVAASEIDAKLAPAVEMQDAKQTALDNFLSYNVYLFELLRDRTSKKKAEEEIEEVAAEVAMEKTKETAEDAEELAGEVAMEAIKEVAEEAEAAATEVAMEAAKQTVEEDVSSAVPANLAGA